MFSTKSVQSLRRLFAGYHEPLPLSKSQSQKLLDGLKASFRTQLDLEYGQGAEKAPAPGELAQVRHSAATQHLKSILSNPLFSYGSQTAGQHVAAPLSFPKRDPMEVFDHAVARGMMTLRAATGCLVTKRQLLSGSAADMASSEAAARVVRWLRSTGAEAALDFLDNQAFFRALTPLLVAEGLESVAWEWMTRTVNDATAGWGDDLRIRRASGVLAELVRTKSLPSYGNLDAAIQTILDAEQRFKASPLLPGLLVLPWRSLSWLSTVESHSRAAPSEGLFDAHVATADVLGRPFTIEKAHLHLHHPKHPDHTAAVHFFHDRQRLRRLVHKLGPDKVDAARARGMSVISWIAFLGHDTVSHLAQSGRSREAEDVTELLRSELSDVFSDTLSPT